MITQIETVQYVKIPRYDKTNDISKGSVSLSMARRAAFEAYMYVQEIKYMIPLVNDWISTGHAYVNRIFRYELHVNVSYNCVIQW
jgi:hypothetical protein